MTPSTTPLHQQTFSLDHGAFAHLLTTTENLLIIQDLDGVCMGLVKDPLTRTIDPNYLRATQAFDGHFYVLTNGEHIGQRGVNGIVERAMGASEGYLPGLAAGGVQWQTRAGNVSHPGVSDAELAFLKAVPERIQERLQGFFEAQESGLGDGAIARAIEASALDNVASPTANLNTLRSLLSDRPELYLALQREMAALMKDLLQAAADQGLGESFFMHFAPNLGRDDQGNEVVWYAEAGSLGTTDFQFMLRGAIKEAGVLALLNRYYHQRTGEYPLGESFNARSAPQSHGELLTLAEKFDPEQMPLMVGVGDTVTSQVVDGKARRGGSDRNFLQLIQDIGRQLGTGNLVVYVDSSGGEVKRRPLTVDTVAGALRVTAGPGDPRDPDDPLTLNLVFPGGHRQYIDVFCQAAQRRQGH
ncbi:MAG: glucosylglycerol 3-phosphatase [Cyanobacteria bacterium P01_A01_bin.135]